MRIPKSCLSVRTPRRVLNTIQRKSVIALRSVITPNYGISLEVLAGRVYHLFLLLLKPFCLHTGVKKLPCNHLFHAICLRSWFQRQQTCPTCRLDVLRQTPSRTATTVPPAAANPPPAEGGQPQGAANDNEQPVTARELFFDFIA